MGCIFYDMQSLSKNNSDLTGPQLIGFVLSIEQANYSLIQFLVIHSFVLIVKHIKARTRMIDLTPIKYQLKSINFITKLIVFILWIFKKKYFVCFMIINLMIFMSNISIKDLIQFLFDFYILKRFKIIWISSK